MTTDEFIAWASDYGLRFQTIEQLARFAATQEEMEASIEAIEPAPPIYTLEDIKEMNAGDTFGISPAKHGFMLIGGCPNGDPIALDIADDRGSVWYISHTSMHTRKLRSVSIRVANDTESLVIALANDDDFPLCYFDARESQR